ncbi:MAG TPA: peptidoglycan DD-metalloendopeptidase family protein [Fermentimonas sp.]|nr:peptidoglycan DD-metalloendopeptidase family protein [Fermentimonas sp.]
MLNSKMKILAGIGFSLFLLFFYISCDIKVGNDDEENSVENESNSVFRYGICVDSLDVNYFAIERGDLLSSILRDLGFNSNYSEQIALKIEPYYSASKLQIGNPYVTVTSQDSFSEIKYIVFEKNRTDFVVVDLCGDDIIAYESSKPITLKREYAEGTITSSLWNTLVEAGAPVLLALKLSDIFAWQIDFFDVKEGDNFRLIYDAAYINDTSYVDIVSIEGAVFTHQGKKFKAIPFEQDSVREFFDEKGNSLRKAFLKSPLDFYRISSKFSNARFHPILKRYRPHHGVDYAAPAGTPVKTIGDGLVIEKAFQRNGAGYYVKVKHNATYTTTYMHLSGFAKNIEKGAKVKQGDVIGYVGSTGLSTGPHLDFRVHKNNQPINPLTVEAPPSLPVKEELRDSFILVQNRVMTELDSMRQVGQFYVSIADSVNQNKDNTSLM